MNVTPRALSTGYSDAHLQYHNERNLWAGIASRGHTTSAIIGSGLMPLAFVACYETLVAKGKDKEGFKYILHIREAERVSNAILPGDIIALAKKLLQKPLSRHFKGFLLDLDQTTVRERLTWEDVSRRDPDTPYFSGRTEFFVSKPGTAKGTAKLEGTFKAPKNAIEFVIVIDSDQWNKFEQYEDSEFVTSLDETTLDRPDRPQRSIHRTYSPSYDDASEGFVSRPPSPLNISKRTDVTETSKIGHGKRKSPPSPEKLATDKSSKRINDSLEALNMTLVRNGLLRGGQALVSMTDANLRIHENIVYYGVQNIPLIRLLEEDGIHPVQINISLARLGSISYIPARDSPSFLGKGSFKTAHLAELVLQQPVESGLGYGVSPNHFFQVALKRPYNFKRNKTSIQRLGLLEEGHTLSSEANVLGWARSIMEFTYGLINTRIAEYGSPPCAIPRLRFVDSALVFVQKDVTSGLNMAPLSNRAVYLLEELIPGAFTKYIHNGCAAPLLEPQEASYSIAEFLCFTQHLQFSATFGLVFISDYQGGRSLLTDPQIMTNPNIGPGKDLFGDGNDSEMFLKFSEQHLCNKFCRWMGLKELDISPDHHQTVPNSPVEAGPSGSQED